MNIRFQTVSLKHDELTYLNIAVDLLAVISMIMEGLIASDTECITW